MSRPTNSKNIHQKRHPPVFIFPLDAKSLAIYAYVDSETYHNGSYFLFFQQLLVQPATNRHEVHPVGISLKDSFLLTLPLLKSDEEAWLLAGRFNVEGFTFDLGAALGAALLDAGFFMFAFFLELGVFSSLVFSFVSLLLSKAAFSLSMAALADTVSCGCLVCSAMPSFSATGLWIVDGMA